MAARTFVPVCSALLLVSVLVLVSAEQKNITAVPGQNVTLTCRAPNNNTIHVVKWSRADLGTKHVLLYQDGHFVPADQHPSFKNRVDLQDRQMKDGDVSLILKNVTAVDNGTYECHVVQSGKGGLKLLSNITLRVVDPPGPTGGTTEDGGSVGLIVGVSVAALLLVVVVGFVICRKHKQSQDPYRPPDELQPV